MPVPVFFAGLTHVGNFRKNNEDYVLVGAVEPDGQPMTGDCSGQFSSGEGGCFLMVCDGLGGSTSGEIASEIAARAAYKTLCALHTADPGGDPRDLLRRSLIAAHQHVLDEAQRNPVHDGMASTGSCLWCKGESIYIGQVGDSRTYRYQSRTLRQVSVDQSPVGKLMAAGRISEAEARKHPLKNYVDEVLGGAKRAPVPQSDEVSLKSGDLFLICSDGLSDSLDDESLAHIIDVNLAGSPEVIARELLQKALARAGRDNVTLIVLRAEVKDGSKTAHRLMRLFGSPQIERVVVETAGGEEKTVRLKRSDK